MRRAGKLWVMAVLAGAVALALVTASSGARTAPVAVPLAQAGGVKLTDLGDFDSPVHAATAPGKANRKLLFVVEQGGAVKVLRKGRVLKRPFFDISDRIAIGGERGLLSIAFAPDYAKTRRLYAYYTGMNGDIRVSQLRRSAKSKVKVDPKSLRKVIQIPHRDAPNHNGGQVAFGPDGNLWLGTGDGGASCDPDGNSQNPSSLLGKLLRISPSKHGGYTIPDGNPFADGAGRDEIYASGLRNPFRFSFDDPSGTIAIGDVGQNAIEEVDYERVEDVRGANFGWDAYEGSTLGPPGCADTSPAPADHTGPIYEYRHSGGDFTGCSIIGGMVVRDKRLAGLNGRYIYSDICNGQLRSLVPNLDGATGEGPTGLSVSAPTSFTEDRRHRVYVTSLDGDVFRLDPARRGAERRIPARGRGGARLALVDRFSTPTYATGPKGANGLLFVTEKDGVIRAVRNGKKLSHPFLDIRKKVLNGDERGLLSVAFSPTYGRDGLFYVYYTNHGGNIEVEEYRRSGKNAADAKEGSARTVITIPHPNSEYHNGGQLQFGPDGNLYLGTGDGGATPQHAQDKGELLGKILRISPARRKGKPYTIPKGNPFVGKDGQAEVFALGFRNPYRFSFDRRTGRLAIGDVGQEKYEEVDYESIGGANGANFGWPAFEGDHRYHSPDAGPAPKHRERPIFEYVHGDSRCAVIGGYVSRDGRIPSLSGRYLYGDLCSGEIRSFVPGLRKARGDRSTGLPDQPGFASFGEDSRGGLYVVNTAAGKVFAIKP